MILSFMPTCVPQSQLYLLSVPFNICHMVFRHRGYIHLWELVFAKGSDQASLVTGSISNNHQFLLDGGHRGIEQWGGKEYGRGQMEPAERHGEIGTWVRKDGNRWSKGGSILKKAFLEGFKF